MLKSGHAVFIKAATDDTTAAWLRQEQRVYGQLEAPFVARRLAFIDGPRPVMVLEDLSGACWPPPWRKGQVAAVRRAMAEVAACKVEGLPSVDPAEFEEGWQRVAAAPDPFLSLRLVSPGWLRAALPTLIAAERSADVSGDALLHNDLRSDNLCFAGERVVLVDWNFASVGNPALDVAFWAPSLSAEGGARPEEVLPDAPEFSALVSGYFAARAGLPPIPSAPRVRHIQQVQLRAALPWVIRALGLPGC